MGLKRKKYLVETKQKKVLLAKARALPPPSAPVTCHRAVLATDRNIAKMGVVAEGPPVRVPTGYAEPGAGSARGGPECRGSRDGINLFICLILF